MTTDPKVPFEQWTKVNEKPIPPSGGERGHYTIPRDKAKNIKGVYVTAVNALGYESDPGDVVYAATENDPGLVLKTLLDFKETTDEGQLIEAVTLPWLEILELLAKDPEAAFQIPARKWEEIVAGAYHRAGFEDVILTPRSGDYGRDVIAVKKGIGRIRVIDQVKAYKPGHLVTADDVRALVGVLHGDGASKGFLTTTSDFAPKLPEDPLISKFMPAQLELINGAKLLSRLMELRRPTWRS